MSKKAENTKVSKKNQDVVLDDVSENENDDNSVSDVEDNNDDDNEGEDEEEEDEDENEGEKEEDKKKDKSKKLTHEELCDEINNILESESVLENEIIDFQTLILAKMREKKALTKKKNKIIGLLPKAYLDGLNKAKKEKKKRTNNTKSGILAEHPVPPVLLKFLNLPENTLMMRPKVFSLLNIKFKELGLKKGQNTILDKKTAKIFGVEEGHVIHFQEFQKFLAVIYEKANAKQKEVSL